MIQRRLLLFVCVIVFTEALISKGFSYDVIFESNEPSASLDTLNAVSPKHDLEKQIILGQINDKRTQEVCINCVPIKDCVVFGNLTKSEQKRWTADFSCTIPKLNSEVDFGFAAYAKGDYICCPHTNAINFPNDGQVKSHASQSITKYTRSADVYNPTDNPMQYESQRQSENIWMNQDGSEFLNNDGDKEYDSQRMPYWQQGPFNMQGSFNRQNRPMQGLFGNNPYFMGRPRTQPQGQARGPNRYGNANAGSGGQCSRLTSFPPEPNNGCCGRDVSDADRIIGGQTTEIDQFPWTVLLNSKFTKGRNQAEFSCGGSLISVRYVLTAAHCLYDEAARLTEVEIFLAEYDKRTFPRDCMISPGEGRRCIENIKMRAEDVVLHPQYDDTRLQNDVALIRLRGTAPYTDYIRPICLPVINVDSPDFSNLPLSVAGWGRNGRYQSDVKQSTVVNLVPQRECTRHYPHLTKRHLCAAGHTGEDTCKGDSGGPLMMLHRGKYFVAGIVSGKRADSPCGSSVPSLYTNVYNYLDWIRANIKN